MIVFADWVVLRYCEFDQFSHIDCDQPSFSNLIELRAEIARLSEIRARVALALGPWRSSVYDSLSVS